MKKLISFTILFLPWLLSFTLLPFSKINISCYLLYFLFVSILFYFYFNLFVYNIIKNNDINSNFILIIVILYILNQSFNILVLYYNSYFLSFIISILSFITLFLFIKNKY